MAKAGETRAQSMHKRGGLLTKSFLPDAEVQTVGIRPGTLSTSRWI